MALSKSRFQTGNSSQKNPWPLSYLTVFGVAKCKHDKKQVNKTKSDMQISSKHRSMIIAAMIGDWYRPTDMGWSDFISSNFYTSTSTTYFSLFHFVWFDLFVSATAAAASIWKNSTTIKQEPVRLHKLISWHILTVSSKDKFPHCMHGIVIQFDSVRAFFNNYRKWLAMISSQMQINYVLMNDFLFQPWAQNSKVQHGSRIPVDSQYLKNNCQTRLAGECSLWRL